MIWACPLCQQGLFKEAQGLRCLSGHSFDRAKQGYVNLLPAHHRRSSHPGDDRNMLIQRQKFLQKGHFQPLEFLLQTWLQRRLFQAQRSHVLLDSGCGEGFYLSSLLQVKGSRSDFPLEGYGLDISKEAAKLTSRRLPADTVVVASAFQLPVMSDSVDVLLRVFAPGSFNEVARVLKPNGELWLVTPGPRHLFELKEFLYDTPMEHDATEVPEGFSLAESERLHFSLSLKQSEDIQQLLAMTPLAWCGRKDGREALSALEKLQVTIDFSVFKLQPTCTA